MFYDSSDLYSSSSSARGSTFLQIKDMRPGQKSIATKFIVLEVGPPIETKKNHKVRIFKVADETACINAIIWDEVGQHLKPGDIVRLTKGYLTMWNHCLTLYTSRNGALLKVDEFCMIFNEELNMSDPNLTFLPPLPVVPVCGSLDNLMNNGFGRIGPPIPANNLPLNNGFGRIGPSLDAPVTTLSPMLSNTARPMNPEPASTSNDRNEPTQYKQKKQKKSKRRHHRNKRK